MKFSKLTTQDLHAIAAFNKMIKNYLMMKSLAATQ
jgi:hypothetical protein